MNPSSLHCRAFLELALVSDFLHPLSLCPHCTLLKISRRHFIKHFTKLHEWDFFPQYLFDTFHFSLSYSLCVSLILRLIQNTVDVFLIDIPPFFMPSALLVFFVFCSKKRPSQRGSKSQDVGRCRRSCYPLLAFPSGWKARFHRNRNRTNRVLKDTISE